MKKRMNRRRSGKSRSWTRISTTFDPWEAASGSRKVAERKKTLRLAGNGARKAHILIKLHAWRGKAIYVYHLVRKAVKRVDKPTGGEWGLFSQLGTAIAYPSRDHPSTDVEYWVGYGKEQARKLGLKIVE
jgi:hypothetical protein